MKEKKNTLDHNIKALIKTHFEREIGAIEQKPFPAELRLAISKEADLYTQAEPGTRPGTVGEHRLRDILFKAAGIALIILLPSLAVFNRHKEPPLAKPIAEVWESRTLGTKVISGLSRLQNIYHNTQK